MGTGLMDDSPPDRHSFVIKIWAKEVENPREDTAWRGSVTHVGSGRRLYLESLVQVSAFIAPYLVELGGSLDLRTRLYLLMVPPVQRPDRHV